MSATYQSFYQNEVRALQLEIDDNDGTDFVPSGAYVQVQDSDGDTVVAEQAALVSLNTVSTLIGTSVTSVVGEYRVIWRILHSQHTYYHITELQVESL